MQLRELIHNQIDQFNPEQLVKLEKIMELLTITQQEPVKDKLPWRRAREITDSGSNRNIAQEIIDARADRV